MWQLSAAIPIRFIISAISRGSLRSAVKYTQVEPFKKSFSCLNGLAPPHKYAMTDVANS